MCFYIDDIFESYSFFEKKYNFLLNYFLFRIFWSQMKIFLKKLKIKITQIKILKQIHKIEKVFNIKQNAIDIIKNWSRFNNSINVKNFINTIQFCKKYIKKYEKLI